MKPIKWMSLRRNEVGQTAVAPSRAQMDGKSGEPMGINIEDARQQRAGLFLRDVCYRIHGWFEFIPPEKRKPHYNRYKEVWADSGEANDFIRADDSEAKFAAMFERRARKGQCFHRPYLGCREFACYFRLLEEPFLSQAINVSDDLGWMLYDMNYDDPANIKPEFFRARLENGVVNTDRRVVEVRS